ncbi:MAG: Hsp33 family molecular chaperone HslO [Clostridia bacterium]|nr:Hsp33 family molecular chaperone HslO [Clostridia bacterium]
MGHLIRCITTDGQIAATAVDTTDIVNRAEHIHQTSAVVSAALGRLLTAASLMGHQLKGEKDTLTLRIKGDGEVECLIAVSDSQGNVRGYPGNPIVEIPLNNVGKLDVKGAVGNGTLSVSKDLGMKEPYNGTIELVSGEIAEDIAAYFAISEQIPTVCALGVLVNPDLSIKAAGGYLIQLLPFAEEKTIDALEESIKGLPSVTEMLSSGMNVEQMVRKALNKFEVEVLDEADVAYKCNCSRERVERALISIGKKDLLKLAEEQKVTEANCHFCEKIYRFNETELKNLAKSAK